jgi:cell division protein FtsB
LGAFAFHRRSILGFSYRIDIRALITAVGVEATKQSDLGGVPLNKAANAYWTDDRLRAQRVAARAIPALAPARDFSREVIGSRAEIRRRGGLIPSWVIFTTIIFATFALCVSVTMRTRTEVSSAYVQYEQMTSEVATLRSNNADISSEVRRLKDDPRAIESAARSRLSMARANEIIVPVE